MDRRTELADRALDYVAVNGLIGLSLRPLAAALDTSDRMLIYHFTSKERLVGAVLDRAQHRLAGEIGDVSSRATDLAGLVDRAWAGLRTPAAAVATRLYLETSMLALQEPERWSPVLHRLREPWRTPLEAGLPGLGVDPRRAGPLADLILATLDGLALERLTASDPAPVDAAAAEFGELLARAHDPSGRRASPSGPRG